MLAPWKASYAKTRLCIKKQRHQFADKCPYSQSYGFSSSHVQCDSWAIKKAECWRIDAFKLWCWRRLLRVLWTARRSNQSILNEINTEYWLEGLMLKVQYFGHLIWRANFLEKTLMLREIRARGEEGVRGWDGSILKASQWTRVWTNSESKGQGSLACRSLQSREESDVT